MSAKLTMFIIGQVPEELGSAWLQHLRDFDVAHPGCHFSIVAEAPEMTMSEIVDMLRVRPEFKFVTIVPRDK